MTTAASTFWLRVEWLWQEPLSEAEMVLWEILGYESVVERLIQAIGLDELHRLLRGWEKASQDE